MHNINYGMIWYGNYYRHHFQFYTKLDKNGPKHGRVTFCNNSHLGGTRQKLECRPMPNVMVALPNIGGALCSLFSAAKFV